jgi:predicted nuclease of predicted toxin-antitoxin system
MRLLLDTCMWGGTVSALAAAGHDVDYAGNWERDPGDEAILRAAHEAERIVITLDKGFGELAVVKGHTHSGIIRIVGGTVTSHAGKILTILDRHGEELARGAIVTVEENRTRIRLAD